MDAGSSSTVAAASPAPGGSGPSRRIRNRWAIVTLSSAAFFVSYFGRMMWSVLDVYATPTPSLVEDALIFSLFFAGYIAVQIPAGLVSDRVRPNLVTGGSLLAVGGTLLLGGLAGDLLFEYLASVLMGLAAGWIYPDTVRVVTALFPEREKRTVAIGYYSLAWPLSVVLLGLLLPATAEAFGWRGGYALMALVAFALGGAWLLTDVRGFRPQRIERARVELGFLVNRNSILIAVGGFAFFLPYWAITLYAFDYFTAIGLPALLAGLAVAFLALAGLPSTLGSGFVMNRFGIRRTAVGSLLLYGVTILLLAAFRDFLVILAVALAMGFFRFLLTPINAAIVSVVGEERAGHVTGFANLFWQASGFFAPLVAAFLIGAYGYAANWTVMAVIVFGAAFIYALLDLPAPPPGVRAA